MTAGIYCCTQAKGWIDNRLMRLWKENVWKPYVEGKKRSALILYRVESHVDPNFIDTVDELGTRIITIPGGFMSVNQPSDVGIIEPIMTCFSRLYQD